ncbi:hypothetical protein QUF49_14695 [Fictibacillus sp. b24]|uniref:hypothetical protein n=1 Tax=Fictibacillus sp. b24 TaxID=3055863 RepID=UPI0025A19F66|nr:hypothetical protein [Fictibacillus sp. b24]MDM5317255.1 hypothetical protein [Fictibacillus sp. b24]
MKKYFLLQVPLIIIGMILLIYLPSGQKHYAILMSFLLWNLLGLDWVSEQKIEVDK